MKAAVYYGPGDIRVEDRPEPDASEDNLVVQVHGCAIGGTDVKLATTGYYWASSSQIAARRRPRAGWTHRAPRPEGCWVRRR